MRLPFLLDPLSVPLLHMDGLAAATARGKVVLQQWTQDGTLVSGDALGAVWGVNCQTLQEAEKRGDLFAVEVAGQRWYLGLLGAHCPDCVAQVCRALRGVEPTGQVIYWLRRHGGLGGKTVGQALQAGRLERVLELARAWASERVAGPSDVSQISTQYPYRR